MIKRAHLVVYDYGQGGVWAYVFAESAAQIEREFPELRVVSKQPEWMTPEQEAITREKLTFDIDEPPTGFLAKIVAARESDSD